MDLDKPIVIKQVSDRYEFIKKLAHDLKASYCCYAENSYRFNDIKKQFNLAPNIELNNSNIITGKYEGYDYCFVERFSDDFRRLEIIKWTSTFVIKTNNKKFPDFKIIAKKSYVMFNFAYIMIPIALFAALIGYYIQNGTKDLNNLYVLAVMAVVSTLIFIVSFIIDLLKIKQQNKYKINNLKFKDRYIILSEADPNEIEEVFDDRICSRIAGYYTDLELSFKSKCFSKEFSETNLTFDLCDSNLKDYFSQVQLFEKD